MLQKFMLWLLRKRWLQVATFLRFVIYRLSIDQNLTVLAPPPSHPPNKLFH